MCVLGLARHCQGLNKALKIMETTAKPRFLLQEWLQKPSLQSLISYLALNFKKTSIRSLHISSLPKTDNKETLYIKSIPGAEESILEGLRTPISDLHEIEVTKEFLGIN